MSLIFQNLEFPRYYNDRHRNIIIFARHAILAIMSKIDAQTILASQYLLDPIGHEHKIQYGSTILGRSIDCAVIINDVRVSREHSRIFHEGHHWYIEDLKSTNGTYLNNERVTKIMELRDGDTIQIGDTSFSFHDPDSTIADLPFPNLIIDFQECFVRVNRKKVLLSPKEYALIVHLYNNRQNVCSKEAIGQAVWPEYNSENVFDYQIENLVRRLRKRLEIDPGNPQLLITIRGIGYKLNII